MTAIRPLDVPSKTATWPLDAKGNRIHWSKLIKVHPAAALFAMLDGKELAMLVEDVKINGIQTRLKARKLPDNSIELIDGRLRLEAAYRSGYDMPWMSCSDGAYMLVGGVDYLEPDEDPIAYIISANIHRRHLTKEQQADLIWKVKEAAQKIDLANIARSFNPITGKKGGSTKDELKQAVVAEAKKHGISERTVRLARAKQQKAKATATKPKPKPKPKPKAKSKTKVEGLLWSTVVGSSMPLAERVDTVKQLMAHLRVSISDLRLKGL